MIEDETVEEYIYSICRNKGERDKVKQFIINVTKKFNKGINLYNKDFTKIIPLTLRMYFNVKIKKDFKLSCLLSNHFVLRLLTRFRNDSIIDIMSDINRILINKDNYIIFNGNNIIELYGISYFIVYSSINNILLTIIPYNKFNHQTIIKMNLSKNRYVYNRRNNGYDKKKKMKLNKYNRVINRQKTSRRNYL